MKRYKIVLIIAITICGCKKDSINNNVSELKISLSKNYEENILFDPAATDLHFKSYFKEYPEYYKELLNYDGKPIINTSFISQYNYNNALFYYNLYMKHYMSEINFKQMRLELVIDTSKLGEKGTYDQLSAFTGFNNNKQVIIIDSDNDKDFSNEIVQYFDVDFGLESYGNKKLLYNLPLLSYKYEVLENSGLLQKYSRKIIVFPSTNDYCASIFEDSLNKRLHIIGRLKDFWKGSFVYKGIKYSIAAQGLSKEYLQILIKPDTLSFSYDNLFYNKNFEYRIKDTISISNDLFIIDSLIGNVDEISLKRVNSKTYKGFRKGETIADLELTNLDSSKINLSSIINKPFTLLDFWGTWCQPCLENTPALKKIQNKYESKLSIVGIALDDISNVNKYVTENQLNWYQTYVKREFNPESILNTLRISGYPTYILLDKDFNIVYRETGPDNLDEIEKIILTK